MCKGEIYSLNNDMCTTAFLNNHLIGHSNIARSNRYWNNLCADTQYKGIFIRHKSFFKPNCWSKIGMKHLDKEDIGWEEKNDVW